MEKFLTTKVFRPDMSWGALFGFAAILFTMCGLWFALGFICGHSV